MRSGCLVSSAEAHSGPYLNTRESYAVEETILASWLCLAGLTHT